MVQYRYGRYDLIHYFFTAFAGSRFTSIGGSRLCLLYVCTHKVLTPVVQLKALNSKVFPRSELKKTPEPRPQALLRCFVEV